MPLVKELTEELRKRLPNIPDVNGNQRSEFGQVFDLIEAEDPSVKGNYERLFEWIKLISHVRKEPFKRIISVRLDPSIINAMGELTFVVGGEIARLLESRQTDPTYLTRFADFIPAQGRLKIFTLNYDCCLEDACRSAGIELTTGFDLHNKKWKPSLFRRGARGINLYKLHGSLRWHGVGDESGKQIRHNLELMELGSKQSLPHDLSVRAEPELVLGPGNKLQPDDPFVTLFYEFQRSIRRARICVIIGYGYSDSHVNSVLDRAIDRGVRFLDVNPTTAGNRYRPETGYHHLGLGARSALEDGRLRSALEKLST